MRIACTWTMRGAAWLLFAGLYLAASAAAQGQPLDIVLVLDNSGSMRANDPKRLLRQAVSEFAAQLPPDSRMGIVLFDQRVEQVLELSPVSDAAFQSLVAESLTRVDFSGDWTDIPGGIER